jgi:hypothetical protein
MRVADSPDAGFNAFWTEANVGGGEAVGAFGRHWDFGLITSFLSGDRRPALRGLGTTAADRSGHSGMLL